MSSLQPPQESSTVTATHPKPFYKRWWFITLAVFAVLGIIGSIVPESSSESNSEDSVGSTSTSTASSSTTTELVAPWSSLLLSDIDVNKFVQSLCKPLEQDLNEMSDLVSERLTLSEESSQDAYASAEFLESTQWENVVSHWFIAWTRQMKVAYNALKEVSKTEPRDEQLSELLADARSRCGLTVMVDELFDSSKTLDERLSVIKTQSQNLP